MNLPSESDILDLFQRSSQQQFAMRALLRHFGIPASERPAFRRMIRGLVADGRLLRRRGSHYALPDRLQTLVGVVKRHEDGYGFVTPDDESRGDVYIPRQSMYGVLHGDRVLVRLSPLTREGDRPRGRVVQILDRSLYDIVGRIETMGKSCVLHPIEGRLAPEIYIPPRHRHGVKRGQIVVAEIDRYVLGQEHPHGRITEILGYADDPEMDMEIILRTYDLPRSFPPEVEAAAQSVPQQISPGELRDRRDLRQLTIFTIDGETARDYDDAVSLETLSNGHVKLGVHIADVGHYVREGSVVDREAYIRGISVYFPDRVIPMLPSRLSNEICCLQPEADRLTRSVCIEITPGGDVVRYHLMPSIIRSQARLTYTQVADYLEGNSRALAGWNPAIGDVLVRMDVLAEVLRRKRIEAGSIDFDLPESDIILDNEGKIDNILRAERNRAHALIEEFMLLANRTVARHLARLRLPALYRVHEQPPIEKIARFNAFVRAFGYALGEADKLQPRDIQRLLLKVRDKPEEDIINRLLLRSMSRARYAHQNAGHFGLAFMHYTHFTSPIRRYADLIVHRLLHDVSRAGKMPEQRLGYWAHHLPPIAEQVSTRERIADEAERAVIDLMKVEFMRDKVGQEFDGVITHVTHFGLFVELEALFVDGLVHINWLPDEFVFQADRFCLVGQRSGQRYRLGDRVRVRVDKVDLGRRQIDFSLLAML